MCPVPVPSLRGRARGPRGRDCGGSMATYALSLHPEGCRAGREEELRQHVGLGGGGESWGGGTGKILGQDMGRNWDRM